MKKILWCLVLVFGFMMIGCSGSSVRPPVENLAVDPSAITQGETVFARWAPDGYYYPGVVDSIEENQVNIIFLDGDEAAVPVAHIIELETALNRLALEGNWQYGGLFYPGNLSNRVPMIMNYDDGDVEQVQLAQLRGTGR